MLDPHRHEEDHYRACDADNRSREDAADPLSKRLTSIEGPSCQYLRGECRPASTIHKVLGNAKLMAAARRCAPPDEENVAPVRLSHIRVYP